MPIQDVHAEYTDRIEQWSRISDCLAGRDAILAAGVKYVPQLSGHRNAQEYRDYICRGGWYGATEKTANAFIGQIFRRDPVVVLTPRLDGRLENINAAGESFYTFAKEATFEVLTKGRYGILADTLDEGDGTPHLSGYTSESIRNWREKVIGGQRKVTQIILKESVSTPSDDGFGADSSLQYRVLELDDEGLYRVRLFLETATGVIQIDEIIPRPQQNKRIDYIPFVPLGPKNLRMCPDKPPMLDMVDKNLEHWRHSVDLASGLHKTAFPIPVISGVDPDSQATWAVGGSIVWLLPMNAKAEMLEFKGDGLGSLERALERNEGHMAKLGAAMLEDKKRVTETADALQERSSGESASLADISKSTAMGFLKALKWMTEWVGDDPKKVKCDFNTDFTAGGMSPQDLLALVSALQMGALPLEDFVWNLQRGEVVRPGRSIDEIRHDLETDKPNLAGAPPDPLTIQSAPGGIQASKKPKLTPAGTKR